MPRTAFPTVYNIDSRKGNGHEGEPDMKRYIVPVLTAVLVAVAVAPVIAQEKPAEPSSSTAPVLTVAEWVKGEPVTLEDGKGKNIYVVEFWATWCPPCRKSIPHLTDLQKKYEEKDVVIVGVTDEGLETVKPFVEKMADKMDYRIAIDKDRQTFKAFSKVAEIDGIPTAFVIDKTGKVVWHGHPMGELEDILEDLTKTSESTTDNA